MDILVLDDRAPGTYLHALRQRFSNPGRGACMSLDRVDLMTRILRFTLVLAALCLATPYAAFAQLSASVGADGNTIFFAVPATTLTQPLTEFCTVEFEVDGVIVYGAGTGRPCPQMPAESGSKDCNYLGNHVVHAYAGDGQGGKYDLGQQQVSVTVLPPTRCTQMYGGHLNFDISDRDPAADREVLLSNSHLGPNGVPDTPYPHYQAFLSTDKQIPVDLRIIYNAVQTPGVSVTMSVIDPPDPSPYVAGGSGTSLPTACLQLSHPGDNIGPLAKLTGTDVTDNGNGTYTVNSGANGAIETVLQLDAATVAGDNYRVVATATFPDGSVVTSTSGTITAWKRVFLEKRQMFRRGVNLASDAPIGATHITIPNTPISSQGGRKREYFGNGDYVMMLHAPGFGSVKTPGAFYSNIYQVTAKPHAFTVKAPWPAPATGTVQISGTSVVGTGTHFNSQFGVDDVIDVALPSGGYESRVVTSIADNTHLTVNFPFTFSATALLIAAGDPTLAVGNTYVRLTLDRQLTESYICDPIQTGAAADLTLNDGVEKVSANTTPVSTGDYFDITDMSALTGGAERQWQNPFQSSFTEYVVLPAGNTPIPHAILTAAEATQRFIDKWFSSPTATQTGVDPSQANSYSYTPPPNQQLLLVGDSDDPDVSKSEQNGFLSDKLPAERASVLDRGTVEYDVSNAATALNGANADTVLRRTTVHELTHQWWPNGFLFGASASDHCRQLASYDSQAAYPPADGSPPAGLKFCLMSDPFTSPMMPSPWTPGQTINMVQYYYRYAYTSYHAASLGSGCHSEYLAIRQTADPWTP